MKNLFFALAFLFVGSNGFAENQNNIVNTMEFDIFRSCFVTITTTTYNEFSNSWQTSTTTHYLGEVANNGFGNIDCRNRAVTFVRQIGLQP